MTALVKMPTSMCLSSRLPLLSPSSTMLVAFKYSRGSSSLPLPVMPTATEKTNYFPKMKCRGCLTQDWCSWRGSTPTSLLRSMITEQHANTAQPTGARYLSSAVFYCRTRLHGSTCPSFPSPLCTRRSCKLAALVNPSQLPRVVNN